MSIKVISTAEDRDQGKKEHDDFMGTLNEAIRCLEILAQIQATVGGLSMSSRANKTFNTKVSLEDFADQILRERMSDAN